MSLYSLRLGNDCAGMKMKDLNNISIKYGHFVRGYGSTQSITIDGALGSCNIRSLYDGKPIGYYLVKVWIIDGVGKKEHFQLKIHMILNILMHFAVIWVFGALFIKLH